MVLLAISDISIPASDSDNLPYEKVSKNEPVCIANEVPFDIPESWEWVRLGEIYQHNTGKALNASNRSGELLTYITTSNLYWNRFEIDSLREMYFSESEIEKCTATKGDLLVCEGGDIGRAAIWPYDTDIRIQNHIHRLRSYSEICTEYYYYLFFLYKHAGWIGGKGIGIQGLSANALHSLLFPLPPLSEQHRIATKIKAFEPFLDKYARAEKRLNNLNTHFPDLLKKSILQEAVQGKLVPQDPDDEPASVLLKRIRAEKEQLIKAGKIKRDKHESIIFRRDNSHYEKLDGIERCIDDEIPFEIPDTWVWSRIRNICINIVDCPHSTPKYYPEDTGFYSIDTTCINSDGTIQGFRHVDENAYASRTVRLSPQKSDIVYTREGSIGRAAVLPDIDNICLGQRVMLLRVSALINTSLYQQILMSPVVLDAITGKTRGIGAKHINVSDVCNALVPVPPLGEQARIIVALSTVLPMLKSI